MLELKPGLSDGSRIGPMTQDRCVLAIEVFLVCQLINLSQQRRTGKRRFSAGAFSSSFIESLGDGCFLLLELLEGPFEVGFGIRLLGHGLDVFTAGMQHQPGKPGRLMADGLSNS